MNGGVNTIVAGELTRAAFQNGYETYALDILQRIQLLMDKYKDSLPVSYTPEGVVDAGIPDNWGQAAIYSALIEGLAGVVEKDNRFGKVELSPRWLSAGKDSASVNIAYAISGASLQYWYNHQPSDKRISLKVNGNIQDGTARIMLPGNTDPVKVLVNGNKASMATDVVNSSKYIVIKGWSGQQTDITVYYK